MTWTAENLKDFAERYGAALAKGTPKDGLAAVATLAVEIRAARGGTMSASRMADVLGKITLAGLVGEVDNLSGHLAVQGTRVAVLEARCEEFRRTIAALESERDAYRAAAHGATMDVVDARLKPSGQVAEDEQCLRGVLNDEGMGGEGDLPMLALARLTSLAQRTEMAERDVETLRAQLADQEQGAEHLRDLLAKAHAESTKSESRELRAALSDIDSGGLGPDDVLGRIDRLKSMLRAAQTEVERQKAEVALSEGGRKRWKERALTAESRIAAIQADASRRTTLSEAMSPLSDTIEAAEKFGEIRKALVTVWAFQGKRAETFQHEYTRSTGLERWVNALRMEGDAPQEAKCTCPPVTTADYRTADHEPACPLKRYPCSPTCTHDDAATPGHPERVKEMSVAVKNAAGTDPVLELAKEAGATSIMQRLAFKVGHERGVDDMRAACLEAVMKECGVFGLGPATREALKAAIEGTAP